MATCIKCHDRFILLLLLICAVPVHILASKPDVAYETIEKQIVSEQYDDAIQELKALLKTGSDDERYNRALGYCLEKTWDVESAVDVYKQMIENGCDNPDVTARFADCLKRLNQFDDAIEHYTTVLDKKLRPDGKAAVLAGLAECCFRLKKDEDYRKYLEETRSFSGRRALLVEAKGLNRDKKYVDAGKILSKLYQENNSEASVAYELTLNLLEQKRDNEFVEKLLDKIQPDDDIRQLDIDLARCHLYLNMLEYKKTIRMKAELEKTTRLTPDEQVYKDLLIKRIEDTF